ncbi:TetR/AcrR family transcriptional regulator [Nocardia asteroides]|uniref:TetR/AcrR family transcriptional regulator n=1 Tax=Nocardia asteroides TaxID=1824 RepID=UPI003650F36A
MIAGARRYAGQSVAQRKARRRQQFLDAATRICAERGHLACSLLDLCESASLSKRQFYEEFRTLDEALVTAYFQVQDDAAVAVARALADPTVRTDPHMAVRAALTAYFVSIDSAPHRAAFAVLPVSGAGGLVERQCGARAQQWAGHIQSFLETEGTRLDGDTARLLTAAVNALAREWMTREPELPLSSSVELLADIAMLLVKRGVSSDCVAANQRA